MRAAQTMVGRSENARMHAAAQTMVGHAENTSRGANHGRSCRKCVGACHWHSKRVYPWQVCPKRRSIHCSWLRNDLQYHINNTAFAMQQTIVFVVEKRRILMCFATKMPDELVRERRTAFPHFRNRKASRSIVFRKENTCRARIFCPPSHESATISIAKQRVPMPWPHREPARVATLPTPLELRL